MEIKPFDVEPLFFHVLFHSLQVYQLLFSAKILFNEHAFANCYLVLFLQNVKSFWEHAINSKLFATVFHPPGHGSKEGLWFECSLCKWQNSWENLLELGRDQYSKTVYLESKLITSTILKLTLIQNNFCLRIQISAINNEGYI